MTCTPARRSLLCAGGLLGTVTYFANLRELGNGVALWLGISPPDLFFYAVSAGQPAVRAGCRVASLSMR